jgi:hypothetical protein
MKKNFPEAVRSRTATMVVVMPFFENREVRIE